MRHRARLLALAIVLSGCGGGGSPTTPSTTTAANDIQIASATLGHLRALSHQNKRRVKHARTAKGLSAAITLSRKLAAEPRR